MSKDRLVTPAEAAERLGIKMEALKKMRHRNEITYVCLTKRTVRYREGDIERLIKSRTVHAPIKPLSLVQGGW